MNPETQFNEKGENDFQWAAELGYLNEASLPSAPAALGDEKYHQLMIFTGRHAGASMHLTDGTYSLGRNYECDIVLKDPGIEPTHLKVTCHGSTIALRPELGAVYVNGDLAKSEIILPAPPAVVTIAGVHCGLALSGATWYPLAFPRINRDAKNLPAENQEEKNTDSAGMVLKPIQTAAMETFGAALLRLGNAGTLGKYVPLTFILLFMASLLFLFNVQSPDSETLAMDIENQFAALHLPKPAIQVDAEGFLDITAYAPDASVKQEITVMLQALPVTVRAHVYTDKKIDRMLQDYSTRMAFPVETVYQGNGRVLVKGFVADQQEAEVMASLLKSNVKGVSTVNLHVFPMDQVRSDLLAILKEADLADKIDLTTEKDHLLAQGALDAGEKELWQKAKTDIGDRLGRRIDIVDRIRDQEYDNLPGKVDIPIAGVTMHPHPFITLQDGKVYFKGASMQNGSTIKDIGPERIIVEVNGRDYYYNF